MPTKIIELKQERAEINSEQKDILDLVEKEKREMNADEEIRYENLDKEFESKTKELEDLESAEQRKIDRLKKFEERSEMLKKKAVDNPGAGSENNDSGNDGGGEEERADKHFNMYESYLKYGVREMPGDELKELRSLQADIDVKGGYLVTPQQMVEKLLKAVDDVVYIRQKATVYQVPTAESLGVPSLDSDPGDPEWTAEIKTGSNDDDMEFGKRELNPHPLARRIKVSDKLARQVPSIGALVTQRLSYKFSIVAENAYLNGNGANQPLGLFTASDDGISTSRDVAGVNTATAIKADTLIDIKYNQKSQYQAASEWLFHRDAIKMIRKLKDGNGQYLWQPGLQAGQPDRILDSTFIMSEYAPNTFTTGLYVGLYGDFSFYWIADALSMTIKVLEELYAETNQIGYIGRLESDGMPVLEEAFTRMKMG